MGAQLRSLERAAGQVGMAIRRARLALLARHGTGTGGEVRTAPEEPLAGLHNAGAAAHGRQGVQTQTADEQAAGLGIRPAGAAHAAPGGSDEAHEVGAHTSARFACHALDVELVTSSVGHMWRTQTQAFPFFDAFWGVGEEYGMYDGHPSPLQIRC